MCGGNQPVPPPSTLRHALCNSVASSGVLLAHAIEHHRVAAKELNVAVILQPQRRSQRMDGSKQRLTLGQGQANRRATIAADLAFCCKRASRGNRIAHSIRQHLLGDVGSVLLERRLGHIIRLNG